VKILSIVPQPLKNHTASFNMVQIISHYLFARHKGSGEWHDYF